MGLSFPRLGAGALFLIIFLLFFAPWLSVTCAGVTMVDTTGWNLAWGKDASVTEDASIAGEPADTVQLEEDAEGEIEEWALLALVVAWVGIGLTLIKGGVGAAGRSLMGVLGVVALIALQVKLEGDLDDAIAEGQREAALDANGIGFEADVFDAVAGLIDLQWEAAYWAALVLFAVAALLQLFESPTVRGQVRDGLRAMGPGLPPPRAAEAHSPEPPETDPETPPRSSEHDAGPPPDP